MGSKGEGKDIREITVAGIRASEDIAHLVGGIYESAASDSWLDALTAVAHRIGAHGSLIYSAGPGASGQKAVLPGAVQHTGLSEEALQRYFSYYMHRNVWAANEKKMAEGRAVTSSMLYPDTELKKTEYYADWLRKQDIFYALGGLVSTADSIATKITFVRSERAGPFTPQDVRLVGALMRPWRAAVAMRARLQRVEAVSSGAQSALDSLQTGVILLARNGVVVHCTPLALEMMQEDKLLTIGPGARLTSTDRAGALRIGQMLDGARQDPPVFEPVGASSITLGSGAHRLRLRLCVAACRPTLFSQRTTCAAILVERVVAPSGGDRTARLKALGLTTAEQDLVALMLQGLRLKEIASRRKVTLHTVRSQVAAAMGKLGVHRQSDLIREVLALAQN